MFFSGGKLLNNSQKKDILISRKVLINLRKKVNVKEQEIKTIKKVSSAKNQKNSQDKVTQKNNEKLDKICRFFTKVNVTYFILFLLDIILVIYSARKNIVNYVTVSDQDIFVSKTRYLFLGRNYINLIIISFFYLYTCLMNRFFLQRKNTKKFLGLLFIILVVLNLTLFFLFTKRIY